MNEENFASNNRSVSIIAFYFRPNLRRKIVRQPTEGTKLNDVDNMFYKAIVLLFPYKLDGSISGFVFFFRSVLMISFLCLNQDLRQTHTEKTT